ncbi:hypothetical protein AB0C28_31345 [Nonomuraea sp. NPDC048892]|uniref:hypothetical protein n=1 Tax=Nonomuraea sp. NPDC048892 TaxID=3154624 RepID=UPI0033C4EFC9
MDSHRCARPDSAGDAEPWRCPECGMVWEALSPTPVTAPPAATPEPRKRTFGTPAILTFVAIGAGTLWFGLRSMWPAVVQLTDYELRTGKRHG